MAELLATVVIPQRLADVHQTLNDMRTFSSWLPASWSPLEAITQTQQGKGARATFAVQALGMELPSEIEITEVTPTRVRWSVAMPPVEATLVWDLAEDAGATRATLTASWLGRRLPPWRVRTLAKLRLRMDADIEPLLKPLPACLKDAVISRPSAPPMAAPAKAQTTADGFVRAAGVDQLKVGESLVFNDGQRSVALFRLDGGYCAVDNDCPHRQGPLAQGQVEGGVVTCPLHRRRFDLKTGECLTHPTAPTRAYPVRVEGGGVFIGAAPVAP